MDLMARIASVRGWYHCIELAPGVVTPGAFDMRPHVGHYALPDDLAGLSFLDVGAANGFFSFLAERRGAARVVAVDLPTLLDHDFPPWLREREERSSTAESRQEADHHRLHGGFEIARAALGSRAEKVRARIQDLPWAVEGRFDIVLCSNVISHVRDPLGALDALREVLAPGGLLVLASQSDVRQPGASYAAFVGHPHTLGYFVPSPEALVAMCATCGFAGARVVGGFALEKRVEPISREWTTVVHARRPRADAEIHGTVPPVPTR
jgi:tRNA (mo5U34)-methyltransferase